MIRENYCNIVYPSETQLKPKSLEIFSIHDTHCSCQITLHITTQCVDTTMIYPKCQNEFKIQNWVMGSRQFARIEFGMTPKGISYIKIVISAVLIHENQFMLTWKYKYCHIQSRAIPWAVAHLEELYWQHSSRNAAPPTLVNRIPALVSQRPASDVSPNSQNLLF